MIKVLLTVLICDAVFVLIAVPLVLRKVPRNLIYGFRVKSALQNDFVWYEANAYFGKLFIVTSLASAVLMVLIYILDILSMENFISVSLAVLVVPCVIAIVMTLFHVKTLRQP